MLTLDLLRFRTEGDSVTPIYLATRGARKYPEIADRMIELFKSHVGRTLGELEATLDDMLGSSPDYKVHRGLVKVLYDYAEIAPPREIDFEALRKAVFTLAAESGPPSRTPDLLFTKSASARAAEIAAKLGISAADLPAMLYGDLKENQVIREFDSSVGPIDLIERYNTALAQAMLYRATRMVVDIHDSYRTVFKYIKLARLMHSIQPHNGGYRIRINGPLSLFSHVERYGIAMAKLLPAVLKCEKWMLAAKVNVGEAERVFRLGPNVGLRSHYRDEPVFDSSPEEAFFNKFQRNKKSKWTMRREGSILDLKETVMIPDFLFEHRDGRIAHLEIVGFWSPDYLSKKLDKLSRIQECNVVIAVPESLNCDCREAFSGPVVRYKERLLIKDVLPAIEAVAKHTSSKERHIT